MRFSLSFEHTSIRFTISTIGLNFLYSSFQLQLILYVPLQKEFIWLSKLVIVMVKGCRLQTILYRITPRDQMSEKSVISLLRTRSGEAYSGVPPPRVVAEDIFNTLILRVILMLLFSSLREHPRSQRTYCPGPLISIFYGFKSRCRILLFDRSKSALEIQQKKRRSSSYSQIDDFVIRVSTLPSLQQGVTRIQAPRESSQKQSTSQSTYSEDALSMFLASSQMLSMNNLGVSMVLMAYILLDYLCQHFQTSPN